MATNDERKPGKLMNSLVFIKKLRLDKKSDNLQYNMLGHWLDGRFVSLTKRLMFQVFLSNFTKKNKEF